MNIKQQKALFRIKLAFQELVAVCAVHNIEVLTEGGRYFLYRTSLTSDVWHTSSCVTMFFGFAREEDAIFVSRNFRDILNKFTC